MDGSKEFQWKSSGSCITFLDTDDYLLEGAYKTILQFMENNKADIYEFQTIGEGLLWVYI